MELCKLKALFRELSCEAPLRMKDSYTGNEDHTQEIAMNNVHKRFKVTKQWIEESGSQMTTQAQVQSE